MSVRIVAECVGCHLTQQLDESRRCWQCVDHAMPGKSLETPCAACSGSGLADCSACHGSGGGLGSFRCTACHGRGRRGCGACDETGVEPGPRPVVAVDRTALREHLVALVDQAIRETAPGRVVQARLAALLVNDVAEEWDVLPAAVLEEREACARMAEETNTTTPLAERIRARD